MTDLQLRGMTILELDVTNEDSVRRIREKVSDITGGHLDILVNNAQVSCISLPGVDATIYAF
jgi:1-acylglycerone phosphate reductase